MKNILLLFMLSHGFAYAQEFSFQINFEDSLGNQDSIELGYDVNGTDGIDAAFGEINIISIPYSSGLDVRITDEWINRHYYNPPMPPTYHTKKQIYSKACPFGFSFQTIDIVTENWPVTATWDNSLFNDSCRVGSVFTSITPGGWWDTGSPSNLLQAILLQINEVTFTSNYDDGFFNEFYAYMNDNGDIIPVFWTTFGDETVILNNLDFDINQLTIFPNPTTDFLHITFNNSYQSKLNISVFDILGKKYNVIFQDNSISVQHLKSGIYFVEISSENGEKIVKKFAKK
jgi:hypothetical protein